MTRRYQRKDFVHRSGSVDEPSDLSDILSATSEDETLTPCTSSLSVVTSSWDDTVLGNNTTRTSSYSLREDKFDREASSDVRQMFEAIDCEMYEDDFIRMAPHSSCLTDVSDLRRQRGTSARDEPDRSLNEVSSRRLHRECIGEWKNTFPHMRICGVSLTGATDEGFQVYPTFDERTLPRTPATTSGENPRRFSTGFNGLSVTGRNVDAIGSGLLPAERRQRSSVGEEIFESDGSLVEIIAIDYRNLEESGPRRSREVRRTGIPPITPLGCIYNSLIDAVFDVTWKQVVNELQPLLQKHCKPETHQIDTSLSRLLVNPNSRYHSPDRHPPRTPPNETSQLRSIYTPEKPPSRQCTRNRPPLNDLLRIHRKTLLAREKLDTNLLPAPPLHHPPHSASSFTSASASNILFFQLPGDSLRMTDNNPLSPGRQRFGVKDKLEVIRDDDDHVPAVALATTIQIRGQGIHGPSRIDPLSSLSILPPIPSELNRMTSHLTSSNTYGGYKTANRRLSYRVASALAPKTGRLLSVERPTTIPQSRPVTESGLYHRQLEVQHIRPNSRRHSATNTVNNTSNNNMKNFLKTMIGSTNAQPQVKGIGLQRFHTVIS